MTRRGWIFGALLALQPALAHAGLYMLVDGVPGAVTTAPWTSWHPALSYSLTLDQSKTELPFQLTVTMERSAASVAAIQQAAFARSTFRRIILDNAAPLAAPGSQLTFTRLTCEEAVIRSFGSSAAAGQPAVSELVLTCGRLLWDEFDYNNAGAATKAGKGSWNFRTNTP
jgi:hypothetical protein